VQRTVAYIRTPELAPRLAAWNRLLADEPTGAGVDYAYASSVVADEAIRAAAADEAAQLTPLDDHRPWDALVDHLRETKAMGLITAPDSSPWDGDVEAAHHLLKAAPCATFLSLYGDGPPEASKRVLAVLTGGAHDAMAMRCALRIAERTGGVATVAMIEQDVGAGAEKLGKRGIEQLLRSIGADDDERIETKVVVDNYPVRGVLAAFDGHDLVIVSMNDLPLVRTLSKALHGAAVAVVKRAPPLRGRRRDRWIPQINPSDYAELVQQLRQGSQWNADFVMMLGLASAVATLGLMQNSPAVVIGSMLLAPLMTPMIGFGMALLQANGKLARSAGKAIGLGFLLTFFVSMALGFFDPGDTLSPEVLARGGPNLLDLGIALFAAVAAGYAMARSTLSGAVAGVAIATALVPPVCACGISIAMGITGIVGGDGEWGRLSADGSFMNALGAALLFVTNLFAIILACTGVFSLMGVTVPTAFSRAKRTARVGVIAIVVVLLLLCIPLAIFLNQQMDEGRAQPLGHPVTRAVSQALLAHVEQDADVRVMFMARSSVRPVVVIYLATRRTLTKEYLEGVRQVVRSKTDDPELDVLVIGVRWADEGSNDD
jgi:uncharacterized hydrophobic protein (TIGR00271 family)